MTARTVSRPARAEAALLILGRPGRYRIYTTMTTGSRTRTVPVVDRGPASEINVFTHVRDAQAAADRLAGMLPWSDPVALGEAVTAADRAALELRLIDALTGYTDAQAADAAARAADEVAALASATAATVPAHTLRPGDVLQHGDTLVQVLRPYVDGSDLFVRPLLRFWCRRLDTGREGYVDFGPLGTAALADRQLPTVYLRVDSHRAHDKVRRELGYKPRQFYSLRRGTNAATGWVRVPARDADRLRAITGVTMSRRTDDLHPCIDFNGTDRA